MEWGIRRGDEEKCKIRIMKFLLATVWRRKKAAREKRKDVEAQKDEAEAKGIEICIHTHWTRQASRVVPEREPRGKL